MAITNYNDYIKGLIDAQYNPQVTAAQTAYDTTSADLNAKIANAGTVYQPSRNNAYTTALQQQRLYNENMANMGYSPGGQMSQTMQQRANNNLQTTLGGIDTSQQEYINGLASEIRNAAVTRDTALADIEANRGAAQLDAYNTAQSRADQLYAAGMISAAQYYQMTGIQPKTSGGSSSSYTSGLDINTDPLLTGNNAASNNAALTADTSSFTGYKNGQYYYRGKVVSQADYLRARSAASQH